MWNVCSAAPGPSTFCGLALRVVWDVEAGPEYDVRRESWNGPPLIALRTLSGAGELGLEEGLPLVLGPGTLVLLDARRIRRYRTQGRRWRFWWFEFAVSGAGSFRLGQVFEAPGSAADRREVRSLFVSLRSTVAAERRVATAGFGLLLQRWLAGAERLRSPGPHDAAVQRVIERMHEGLEAGLTVLEMARLAHLGERRFRAVFRALTGESPKRYYDRLRVAQAERLLGLGTVSVGEVAQRLGFSSPFHFSRVFRQHTGQPPSIFRAGG